MQVWKRAHLGVGLTGLLLFLLSGLYMHIAHAHLYGMPTAPRLLYRSAHIYLLWSSLLNFVLGCYLVKTSNSEVEKLQKLGSVLIILGPFMLCAAFFVEPGMAELARPFSRAAIYSSALAVLMHGFTSLNKRGSDKV